jgi:hypothetical protein
MNTGTRRMWSRRFLRAVIFVAPVFSIPKRAFMWAITDYKGNVCKGNITLLCFLSIFFTVIGTGTFNMWYAFQYSSPSKIQDAIQDYKCTPTLTEMIAERKEPIVNGWLSARQDECDKVIEHDKVLQEQQRALK